MTPSQLSKLHRAVLPLNIHIFQSIHMTPPPYYQLSIVYSYCVVHSGVSIPPHLVLSVPPTHTGQPVCDCLQCYPSCGMPAIGCYPQPCTYCWWRHNGLFPGCRLRKFPWVCWLSLHCVSVPLSPQLDCYTVLIYWL